MRDLGSCRPRIYIFSLVIIFFLSSSLISRSICITRLTRIPISFTTKICFQACHNSHYFVHCTSSLIWKRHHQCLRTINVQVGQCQCLDPLFVTGHPLSSHCQHANQISVHWSKVEWKAQRPFKESFRDPVRSPFPLWILFSQNSWSSDHVLSGMAVVVIPCRHTEWVAFTCRLPHLLGDWSPCSNLALVTILHFPLVILSIIALVQGSGGGQLFLWLTLNVATNITQPSKLSL